jgi:hypothetical protein
MAMQRLSNLQQIVKRRISDNLLNLLIPVGSAILGLLMSSLLENWSKSWFDTLTKAIIVSEVLFGVIIISGMISVGVLVRRMDAQQARAEQYLEDIARRLGITVDFCSAYSEAEGANMFRRDQSIIAKAQREILVLEYRSRPPGYLWVTEGLSSYEARRKWFNTLYEKAWEHRAEGSFFVRRIIQLPEGPSQEVQGVLESDPLYAEHLQKMLALQSEFKDSTYVKTSRIVIQATVVLVDDRHVLFELRSEEPETILLGTFHFDDTTGVLVQQLKRLWQRVDAQAILVTKVS